MQLRPLHPQIDYTRTRVRKNRLCRGVVDMANGQVVLVTQCPLLTQSGHVQLGVHSVVGPVRPAHDTSTMKPPMNTLSLFASRRAGHGRRQDRDDSRSPPLDATSPEWNAVSDFGVAVPASMSWGRRHGLQQSSWARALRPLRPNTILG